MKLHFKEPVARFFSFTIPFSLYVLTLAPSVTFTDSGELAAACASLGVAHPTGYPLFVVLGFLWSSLPLPVPIIFKLNLFAAFCTALASMIFFELILFFLSVVQERALQLPKETKATKKKKSNRKSESPFVPLERKSLVLIALASSLLFAFSRTVWAQATAIEVYSLHLVMLTLSILLFLRFTLAKEPQLKSMLIWALILGLGFTNHLTMILLAPAMIYFYFQRFGFTKEAFMRIAMMSIPFALGLSVYLYLPIRSAMYPEFNWGEVHRGFDKFFYHVSGKQYQVNLFNGNWEPQAKMFIFLLPFELAFVGILLAIYGAVRLFQVDRSLAWFMMLLVFGSALYAVNYNVHDADSYFLLAFLGLILLAAVGVFFFAQLRNEIAKFSLLLPLIAIAINFNHNDKRDETLVLDYTKTMLESVEPNALVLSAQWDYFCSAFWYLQRFEGYRPDVVMIEKELLRRTWYVRKVQKDFPELSEKCTKEITAFLEDLEQFESGKPYNQVRIQARWTAMLNSLIEKSIDERPVYVTVDVLQTEPEVGVAYKKVPQGFALRLSKQDTLLPMGSFQHLSSFLSASPRTHLEEGILQSASVQLSNAARYAQAQGSPSEAERLALLAQKIRARLQAR
ncbi:MAG: glycosyltransferase family 117 protein [Chlorobiales bacterium]